ncbi:MAG: hypothetical protein CVT90_02845 [Candidatus Altiarchaeales archaeon HGW-Altiarchaeales-3]|nr:MAG: hypothetical protein CVT90_02845 [Candidatus Altiarchaeales archaeon HGW-Altiarchaeales-3]
MAIIIVIALSTLVCLAYAEDTTQAPPQGPPGGGDISGMVKNLTEKGFDVSKIQAAIDSGDKETAKTLLDAFFTEHPEAKPDRPVMDADHMKTMVQDLASKGNDVSKIQTAIDSGDTTSAQKLLDSFLNEHPDARPTHPAQGEKPAQ